MDLKLNYRLFPNAEFLTFATGVAAIVEPRKGPIQAIVPFADKVSRDVVTYRTAHLQPDINPYTALLEAKGTLRTNTALALHLFADSAAHRSKQGWADAGKNILAVYSVHGWKLSLGYKAETAAVSKIVADLAANHQADVKLIGASELLNELATAETDFENTFALSTKANSDAASAVKVSDARNELTASLRGLFTIISLLRTTQPTNELTALENLLAAHITSSVTSLKAAATRSEKAKKDADKKKADDAEKDGTPQA